ncbi:hypothetical protein HOC73_01965, partial [bacterium]|nr:hypothetical protein [bacterium]
MKKINKKKIALLFAGGSTVNKKKDINNWVLENKEISLIAEILPVFISSKYGGTDMLREINKVIDKNYDQVNGFVLLVDTDLIKKIGLSLTNSLKTISKPVVITSLNIENSKDDNVKVERNFHSGFELKSNLINSVKLSTMKVPAVLILFGDRILKPSKAIMKKSKDFNIFDSIDKKYSGVIDYKLILNEKFET